MIRGSDHTDSIAGATYLKRRRRARFISVLLFPSHKNLRGIAAKISAGAIFLQPTDAAPVRDAVAHSKR
jgi:hypothetical protein